MAIIPNKKGVLTKLDVDLWYISLNRKNDVLSNHGVNCSLLDWPVVSGFISALPGALAVNLLLRCTPVQHRLTSKANIQHISDIIHSSMRF